MQIFIKLFTGKTITINIDPNETIYNIKQKIFNKAGIPIHIQNLHYSGRILNDTLLVNDSNITINTTVHLSLKQQAQSRSKSTDLLQSSLLSIREYINNLSNKHSFLYFNSSVPMTDTGMLNIEIFTDYVLQKERFDQFMKDYNINEFHLFLLNPLYIGDYNLKNNSALKRYDIIKYISTVWGEPSHQSNDRYFYTYSFKITDHYLHVHFPQFIMNSKPTFEELKEYINTPIHWLFYSYPNYILSSDRIFNKIINPLIIQALPLNPLIR